MKKITNSLSTILSANYRVFIARLVAAIVDCTIVFTISFIVCAFVFTTVFKDDFNQQAAPFISMHILLNPISFVMQLVSLPEAYGNVYALVMVLILIIIIEICYYSLFELSPIRRTPGFMLSKIYICYDDNKNIGLRIILRNILKLLSRCVWGIPFLISLFNKKGKTIYDLCANVYILTKE